jgi:hypothetical protein
MVFARVIDGVFWQLDDQISIGHFSLARQARAGFQSPGFIKLVFFELVGFVQAIETLAYQHMAGGTGAGFLARVFDFNVISQQCIANGGAWFNVEYRAIGAQRSMRQNYDLSHGADS